MDVPLSRMDCGRCKNRLPVLRDLRLKKMIEKKINKRKLNLSQNALNVFRYRSYIPSLCTLYHTTTESLHQSIIIAGNHGLVCHAFMCQDQSIRNIQSCDTHTHTAYSVQPLDSVFVRGILQVAEADIPNRCVERKFGKYFFCKSFRSGEFIEIQIAF